MGFSSMPIQMERTNGGNYCYAVSVAADGPWFLLVTCSRARRTRGWIAELWGARSLAFTFAGLVIGSMVYSLPFVVQPIRNAFETIREPTLEAARTLGASPIDIFSLSLATCKARHSDGRHTRVCTYNW